MNTDTKVETAAALILMATIIEEMIKAVFYPIGIQLSLFNLIDIVIFFVAGICLVSRYCLRFQGGVYLKKESAQAVFVIVAMIVLYLISNAKNNLISKEFGTSFLYIILFGSLFLLVGTAYIDYKILLEKLKPGIIIAIIYAVFYMNFLTFKGHMNMSYYILPWAVIALIWYIKTSSKKYLAATSILAFIIFIGGSRGPLLCYIISVVLLNLFCKKITNRSNIIKLLLLAVLAMVLLVNLNSILSALSRVFPEARTLQYLLSGNITDDSSRGKIFEYLLTEVYNNPFSVRGLYADRLIIGNNFYNGNELGIWVLDSGRYAHYAHNLFVELLFDFGAFFGGIICIYIVVKTVQVFRYAYISPNEDFKIYSILVIAIGLLPLMLSSSYLLSYQFWLFAGFIMGIKKKYLYSSIESEKEV